MITLHQFLASLDGENKSFVYDNFLRKYRTIFDETIGILFSDRRYDDFDVKRIYFEGFRNYVISASEKNRANCNLDDWVLQLAKKRAEDIKPEVNRLLIEKLVSAGGKSNWNKAFPLIYDVYRGVYDNVILKCFRDIKYERREKDIRTILHSLFYIDLERQGLKGLIIRKDFRGWLFTVLRNLANNKREEIDAELCVDHHDGEKEIENFSDIVSDDRVKNYQFPEEEQVGVESDSYQEDESSVGNDSLKQLIEGQTDNHDEDDKRYINELEGLLRLMPNQRYADLIKTIEIQGVSRSDYAQETGKTMGAVYNEINEAKTMLMRVALQHKPQRMRYIFKRSSHLMEDEYKRELLRKYLLLNISVKSLSFKYKKKQSQIWNDIIDSYGILRKIHDNNYSIEYSHETEQFD